MADNVGQLAVSADAISQEHMDNLQILETPGLALTTAQAGSVPLLANFMSRQNPPVPPTRSFLLSPLVHMVGAVLHANSGRNASSMRVVTWMRSSPDAIDRLVAHVEAAKSQIPPALSQRLAALPRYSPTHIAAGNQDSDFLRNSRSDSRPRSPAVCDPLPRSKTAFGRSPRRLPHRSSRHPG